MTLRYVTTDTTQEKSSQPVNPVNVPSVPGCSEGKKFRSSAADSKLSKKSPRIRETKLANNRVGEDSLPEQKYVAGLSISLNSVLNSEVNDLILVNHLDNISR